MRIVAGTHRGRTLLGPKGPGLRPTSDRVRESIFNLLGQFFEGGSVLDLYAGTGALALEALSRGMERAVLVDSGAEAAKLVTANAEALGLLDRVTLLRMPVDRGVARLGAEGRRFELVFADPPYADTAGEGVLRSLDAAAVVADGGTVVLEHARRETLPEASGRLARVDERRFGDTVVSVYRAAG